MNRLSVRLFASHVVVALVSGATAYALVRLLTPQLYDRGSHGMGQAQGPRVGTAMLRDVALSATNTALLVGVVAGVASAALVGAYVSRRIMRPLAAVSASAHRMAQGVYRPSITPPRERELAAVAEDINALAARLAETEERRVRLLGEVAHEMRTPLTVMDGYVEGLVDGVFAPGEVLGELGDEVRRLRRLSDDLSALSRAEEGVVDLRPARVDLGDVAARAAERLRPQLDVAGVELRIPAPTGPRVVVGDPDRLAQVVTNLVRNALVATPRGGHVEVRTTGERGQVRVDIVDDGVGLAPDDLRRVFERFYRLPRPGESRPMGTGIGLTIARGIAAAHGGDLTAASPGPGRGATFTLWLPGAGSV